MNAERYRQIDALAEAALKLEGARRSDFLLRACGSDQDLLEQVNALLRAYESADDFLENPAFEEWARDVAEADAHSSLAGRQVRRYLVKSRLGAGGIGEVWLAQDQELGREVALKFLSRELAGDSDQARRFRQEARAASSLSHNNLVTIFDIGEFDNRQFIAQEYIRGKTVREALASGTLGVETVAGIALQIAAGLGAAHAAGIVHRDIKPENIMIRADGTVKIVDFGIARFTDQAVKPVHRVSTGLTRPGIILGTARYMSPEQARGLQVDGRSDIFSMGVVLYEMLTGAAPFNGATPSDVLAAILTQDPGPLSGNTRAVPPEFERIVRRCLAKDPAGRYPSAAALEEDLQRLRTSQKHPHARLLPWAIGVSSALLLLAVAFVVLMPSRRQATAAAPFSSMRMSPLATRGDVSDVTIAHHGNLFAYVAGGSDKETIHLRAISAPDDGIAIAAEHGRVSGIMFSPDDSFLFYRRTGNDGIGELVRVPVRGGLPEHVAGDVSGAASLSPDGKQVAFVRLSPSTWEASLMVGNVDGSGEFPLQILRRPRYFDEESVAWSPDGKAIACFAGKMTREGSSTFQLVEIGLRHPAQRIITSERWIPRGLAWAPGDVLVVTAVSPGDLRQLWAVRRDTGEVTRLTNDLNNYGRVSVNGDGKSMVAVQSQTSQTIWVAIGNDNSRFERVSTTPLSLRTAVGWTVDGKILYTDPADGYRNIWRMDANGANPQRLTSSPIDKDELAQTSDGRYIVFQQHESHIWRIRSDGSEPRQLTDGSHDVHPALTPDGKSMIYASFTDWTPGIGGEPTLWRVSIDGGKAVQVTEQPTSIPSVSPDGKHIACIYFPGKDPRLSSTLLAVTRIDGNGGFTTFPHSYRDETTIAWSPDGKGVDFVINASGAGNIWRQPLNGGPPVQITHFDRDDLVHFAWSRDGRLLCTRGNTTHKAILIQSFR